MKEPAIKPAGSKRAVKPGSALKKTTADQVFEQLREQIFAGGLKPGDRLMPERELAEAMGVSRTTIRSAIGRLVGMGLLEHRQGKGTFLTRTVPPEINPVARAMGFQTSSLEHLFELRAGLESQAAVMAAKRAGRKDIELLKRSLDAVTGRVDEDVAFHMAIAMAAKNPVQLHLLKNLYDYLFYGNRKNTYLLDAQPARIEEVNRLHRRILSAIEKHDPVMALHAISNHGELYWSDPEET